MSNFDTTPAAQPKTLQEWAKWATNYGRNGGTCVYPHIRCYDSGMCTKCEIFEWCTVTGKKQKR